jgi:hypothetical protein
MYSPYLSTHSSQILALAILPLILVLLDFLIEGIILKRHPGMIAFSCCLGELGILIFVCVLIITGA